MKQKFGQGFGSLTDLPGCAQVVVSHGAYVPQHSRGHKDGGKANLARLKVAREVGYDYIICTVRPDNLAQIAILRKNKWVFLSSFLSSATDVIIQIWGRNLYELQAKSADQSEKNS